MSRSVHPDIDGRRVLVVEDEYMIADDLVTVLDKLGAVVIGPAPTLSAATKLVAETPAIDAAVLDLNLRGEFVYPVVETLLARGVPTIFATGYDAGSIPSAYSDIVRCEKPVTATAIVDALRAAIERRQAPHRADA